MALPSNGFEIVDNLEVFHLSFKAGLLPKRCFAEANLKLVIRIYR